ncbi:hypothetical protein KP509_10G067800 [Ceratopteris richardii]|uniref:Uncharacterized protein n=1 Tax=Ceratopteris richardii TaxID=49495 RepID=A0A8T2U306_CERRI|nr:hypothetical protein KP509_10G067800 [Ceratopteris richardii]
MLSSNMVECMHEQEQIKEQSRRGSIEVLFSHHRCSTKHTLILFEVSERERYIRFAWQYNFMLIGNVESSEQGMPPRGTTD